MTASASVSVLWRRLQCVIGDHQPMAIAFSGGTDSTLLAKAAAMTPGVAPPVLIHVRSALIKQSESGFCAEWAAGENLQLLTVDFSPFDYPDVSDNSPRRCYYCKQLIVKTIRRELSLSGRDGYLLADGANLDDLNDYRPGLRATDELGVLHPLIDAGLDKAAIRRLAKKLGVPNWNVPASACLASRIDYGTELTREILSMVAAAEEFLTGLGFSGCRVRYVGRRAEVEVSPPLFRRALSMRQPIISRLRLLGFDAVLLNLEGYRQGSLNRAVAGIEPESSSPSLFAQSNVKGVE